MGEPYTSKLKKWLLAILFIFHILSLSSSSNELLLHKIESDNLIEGECSRRNMTINVHYHQDDYGFFPDDVSKCRGTCRLENWFHLSQLIIWHVYTRELHAGIEPDQILVAMGI